MPDQFIGEIRMFAGNFAPSGWAFCDGRLLPISLYPALFSILGTTYGGDGRTTFALPDLRGRVPVNPGQGPGLSNRTLGEVGGTENVTLLVAQMPAHTHAVQASHVPGNSVVPDGAVWAVSVEPNSSAPISAYSTAPTATMHPQALGVAGASQPHDNMQPFLCVNFIIALQGVFPTYP